MVKGGTLPLRLESLRYGADLVWGEEIIDRKIIGAVRTENSAFGVVEFVSPDEQATVFSTCAEERQKVIFQLGTASPVQALQAAQTVCKDVSGIDINMGCPKSFSVKGGMGAALLDQPELVADLLKMLRRELPAQTTLTCKIRMLPSTHKTRDFMQVCERSGAEAITVHLRLRQERPAEPAHWDELCRLWDAVQIPVLANGDFFNRRQIAEFWKHCGKGSDAAAGCPAGVMIARGALWNPSIFCREGSREPPGFEEMIQSYVRTAVATNANYQNTKWVLGQMLVAGTGVLVPTSFKGTSLKTLSRDLASAKSMAGLCGVIGEPYKAEAYPARSHSAGFYKGFQNLQQAPAEGPEASQLEPEEAENNGPRKARRVDATDAAVKRLHWDLRDELLIPPAASRPKWHVLAALCFAAAVLGLLCFPQDPGPISSARLSQAVSLAGERRDAHLRDALLGAAKESPFLWQDACAPLVNGTRDTVPFALGKPCWQKCSDAMSDAVLASFVAEWHRQLMSSSFGVRFFPLTPGWHALLQWYSCIWLFAVAVVICSMASHCCLESRTVDVDMNLRKLAEAIDLAITQNADAILFETDEKAATLLEADDEHAGPVAAARLELCGGGVLSDTWGSGVSIRPESFEAARTKVQGFLAKLEEEREDSSVEEFSGEVAPAPLTFCFYAGSFRRPVGCIELALKGVFFVFYVVLHCWFCCVLQAAIMAAGWVDHEELLFQQHSWAEPWLHVPLKVRRLMHLHQLPMLPCHISLLLIFFVLLGLATAFFEATSNALQQTQRWTNRFYASFVLADIVQNGLRTSSMMSKITSLVFFLINLLVICLWALSTKHGLVWSCSKAYSSFLFGWLPDWAPLAAGVVYGALSVLHGYTLSMPTTVLNVEGPKPDKFQFHCIPDTWVAYKEVFVTTVGIWFDTTMDVGQSMIFFRAGQPFFATIIFVGVGMQISMLWIDSLRKGAWDVQLLLAAVLQSDTIQACRGSWSKGMLLSELYQKAYREAASEAYLSLLVGIFGLVTVPLNSSLDMCFLLVSVLFSLKSVMTGVSMSAEMLAAEEEVPCGHGDTVPCCLPLIPHNDYYSRKSFAAQRSLHVVSIFRLSEALAVACTLAVCIRCSSVVTTWKVCYFVGLVSLALVFALVVSRGGWSSLRSFTELWETTVGTFALEGDWEPLEGAEDDAPRLSFRGGSVKLQYGENRVESRQCRRYPYGGDFSAFQLVDSQQQREKPIVSTKWVLALQGEQSEQLHARWAAWTRSDGVPDYTAFYLRAIGFVMTTSMAGAFGLVLAMLVVPAWQVMLWSGAVTRPSQEQSDMNAVVSIPSDFATHLSQKCLWLLITWSLLCVSFLNEAVSPFSLNTMAAEIIVQLKEGTKEDGLSLALLSNVDFVSGAVGLLTLLCGLLGSIALSVCSCWLHSRRDEWRQEDRRFQFHLANAMLRACHRNYVVVTHDFSGMLSQDAREEIRKTAYTLGIRPSRTEVGMAVLIVEAIIDAIYGKADRVHFQEFKLPVLQVIELQKHIRSTSDRQPVKVPQSWPNEAIQGWHLCGGGEIMSVGYGEPVLGADLKHLVQEVRKTNASKIRLVFSKRVSEIVGMMNWVERLLRDQFTSVTMDRRLSHVLDDLLKVSALMRDGCVPQLPAEPMLALSRRYTLLAGGMETMRHSISWSTDPAPAPKPGSGSTSFGWICSSSTAPQSGHYMPLVHSETTEESEILADGRSLGLWGLCFCNCPRTSQLKCGPYIGRQCQTCQGQQEALDKASALKCLYGHDLNRSTSSTFVCDACDRHADPSHPEITMQCRNCDFDFCAECYMSRKKIAGESGEMPSELRKIDTLVEDILSATRGVGHNLHSCILQSEAAASLASHALKPSSEDADSAPARIIAHYASDEDLQNQAVKMIVDNGDISSHMGFFDFCVERLSGHALDASQHQAEKQRCMLFLNTLRDKAKETFEHQRFRGLLRQAAELDELQHDLLPFLLLARDETLLEPYLQKKDELEQLTEEIQYWHKSQAPADNQGAQRLLLVSSGHPYQHSMQEIVAVPNAKGLTVVFSSASSTLNSKSFLTIAPSRSAHGSAARSSKMAASAEGSHEFSGTDRQRWTACDFDGTDSLLFSFETDGAGSAEERYGFMAAVLPMQTDKDADMLGKVTAELESNALMINDELATREVNKSKQTALFPVLLSVMKAYAFSGDSQHAAELLHSVLACLGRSTWLSGHTEVAESLGLQSVATLLEQAMAGSNVPKEEQARTTFEAWLEEIRSAVKSGESGSQDAQQLALPIVAQVGPCLEDLRLQILSDCLSKLQAMHEAIAKASKQYSLVQGRMRYHACDQLSLLIASRLLPEGVRLVQSCHPYAAQPHSFDISLDVSENFEVSEVLVALAPCSCSFDREAKVAIQGQDFWGPRPWALEPVTAKVKAGKQLTIGFQTDGDGSGYPERRWRFLAVLADSRLSCSNLAKAAEKIGETMAEAESPCTNKLYSDAVVAEAALAQAREGCVPQLEEILRLVGSSTHVHEGSEDLCEKVCHSLADMCKWFSGQGLPNYLTQWKHKFPSLEEHVSESKAAVSPKRAEVSDSKKANLTSMFWCFNDDGSMVKHADKLVDQFFYCGRRIEATGEICSTGTQCKFCERFQSEVLEGYTRQNGIVSSFAEEARQDFEEVTDSKQLRRSK
ncbi:DUS2 [Symbiodinium microadriaticum]|nr:DUS2 [Symbiodinium microadriaticum]